MSLGTRGFRLAEAMAHALDSRFLQALRDTPSVTIAELRRILRDYLQELLDEDMQRRATTPGNVPLYGAWFPGHPTLETPAHADLEAMQDELDGARDSLQHRDLDAVSDQAAILADRFQVPPSLLPLLSHGLLEVFARYAETRKARTLGDASTVLDISGEAPTPPAPPVPSMQGPRLSEAIQAHDAWVRQRGVGVAAARKYRASAELLQEVLEDKPLTAYTRQDLAHFLETIRSLPKMHNRGAKDRAMGVRAIIKDPARSAGPRITETTAKNHMKSVAALFDFAKETGLVGQDHQNPAKGFRFGKAAPAREQRDAWTLQELQALFGSPVYVGRHRRWPSQPGPAVVKDSLYWLPLLALFHGARLEEMAQLRRGDIGQEDGVWFFQVTDEGEGQSVKTASSIRKVPLHSEFLRMGFLEYLETLPPGPDVQVFPDLKPSGPTRKYGHEFSEAFGTYCTKIGVKRPGLVFHSFRHTVTTHLIGAGLSETMVDHIVGRSSGKSETATRYAKRPSVRVLSQALEKLVYPGLDLGHLYTAKTAMEGDGQPGPSPQP